MSKKEKKKRTAGDIIRNLILVIAIGVFAFSAFQLGKIFLEYKAGTDEYNRVREYVTVTEPEPEQEQEETQTEPEAEEAKPVPPQVDFDSLKAINPDVIGWIQIEGTSISYPIMKGTDNEYYLKHTFEGNYNAAGSIFIDYTNNSNFEDCNTIIYGHNMSSQTMFSTLLKYEDPDYFQEHPIIRFDTIYEEGQYQIAFVMHGKAYMEGEEGYRYYNFIDPASEEEFNDHIAHFRELSLYDTGVDVSYDDHFIMLSTCEYSQKNGRMVVVAKKIESAQ